MELTNSRRHIIINLLKVVDIVHHCKIIVKGHTSPPFGMSITLRGLILNNTSIISHKIIQKTGGIKHGKCN